MTNYHVSGTLRGTHVSEVWIVDGVFSYTAPSGAVEEISGYIYPGLVDTHTHPGMNRVPQPLSDEQVQWRLRMLKSAGVTSVQDCGGQQNPNHSRLPGLPHVIHCGQHIAQVKRYTRYLAKEISADELPSEAVRQLSVSDGWIKIIGDWIDRDAGDLRPLWQRSVLIDAVAAVHEAGGKVTVHSFATETIDDLLEAGVDGIEHGTGMTRDHLIEARDRGILITPTVHQISRFPEFAAAGKRFPTYAARMLGMDGQRREHLALMVEAGTHFLMGTDTAENVDKVTMATEILDAVRDGMPADVVMAAASYKAKERLGLPTWEEGAPADIVVYREDPETTPQTVKDPVMVLIDGIA